MKLAKVNIFFDKLRRVGSAAPGLIASFKRRVHGNLYMAVISRCRAEALRQPAKTFGLLLSNISNDQSQLGGKVQFNRKESTINPGNRTFALKETIFVRGN